MTARSWSPDRAAKRIEARLNEVVDVEIKEYVRDTNLNGLGQGKAYRVHGVHLYVDILNMQDLLGTTASEGETSHKRTLRFLNLHFRAIHRILGEIDAIEVDIHNQRLHAVIAKPYGDEAARIHRAVAAGQLIIEVLAQTGESGDEIIPAAKVRVGIDSGVALAVRNGRRGHSEPLFLGIPANHAAKRAGGGSAEGIYLTNNARNVVGWPTVTSEDAVSLTATQISQSGLAAALGVTASQIVRSWEKDLEANPIGKFVFTGHTPPYANLDLETLSPANSRRQDALSIYADIDGFTSYVAAHVNDDNDAEDVVRVLHVLRSEMDAVLTSDFGGRKVRFVGDCIHGGLVEGTARTTEESETVSTGILCAGALRSSFNLALEKLEANSIDVAGLGLAIGFEFGPLSLTRLGVKGAMVRCAIGRCVINSEAEQRRCAGNQTAIGETAKKKASVAARDIFDSARKRAHLDYDTAVSELAAKNDQTAKASLALTKALKSGTAGACLLQPAAAVASEYRFPPRSAVPSKPAGFA